MEKKIDGAQQRFVKFDRAELDEDNRRLSFSFSSEAPVERYFGTEVLDHDEKSVRMERLQSGGPLLLDHDHTKRIGKIEGIRFGADRKGYVDVRFGKSALAEEIYQDVLDDIRNDVSVGYAVHGYRLEGEGEEEIVRVVDWEPFEVSVLSGAPADFSIGIGRAEEFNHKPVDMTERVKEEIKKMEEKTEVVKVDTFDKDAELRKLQDAENKRVDFIRSACEKSGCSDYADTLIKERKSEEEARELILDKREKNVEIREVETKRNTRVEVNYRYNKSDLKPWEGSKDSEREAYTAGQWISANILGREASKRWVKENMGERAMHEGTGTAGGFVVPEELENGIINLRDDYGVVRSLATVYPMGSAELAIPKRTSGNTAYFPGEKTAPTKSDVGLGQIYLNAKKCSVETQISDELNEDAIISIAALVADEQAYALAAKEDACFILGDGTSSYGGMVGLKTLSEGTAYAGRVTSTSGDDTFQEVIDGDLARMMASIRSYAKMGSMWLSSPTADELVFGRLLRASGGNTGSMVAGSFTPSYAGYGRALAEDCPSGATTDYTSLSMLYFGNFKKGVAFGDRRGMTMKVLNELYASEGMIGIKTDERFDINIHDMGTTSVTGSISYLYGNT